MATRDRGDTRLLSYSNNILTFPCGIKAEITKKKLGWMFKLMKLDTEFNILLQKQSVEIPKAYAAQLKSHLT